MTKEQLEADLKHHELEIIACESKNEIYKNDRYMKGICDPRIRFHREQIAWINNMLNQIKHHDNNI